MKPKLILMSHGHLALELSRSAQMIIGETEGLYTVSMLESDGLEGTQSKLNAVLEEIGPDAPVLVCADLLSGTPCNVAVQAMYQRPNLRVLTGLNLAMAIEYAVSDLEDVDELAAYLQEVGQTGVRLVERPQASEGEEGYED